MFRKFNAFEENKEDKYVLMKNIKEASAIIPNGYIEKRKDEFREVSELTIQIPYYVTNKQGKKTVNKVAQKFLGKGQRINVESQGEFIETFIVDKIKRTDSYYGTNTSLRGQRILEITAYSFDKTLDEVDAVLDNCTIQLYQDGNEETDISDGILNLFEEDNPLWKVKYVSDKARNEFAVVNVLHEEKIGENITIDRMDRPTVLLDTEVDLKVNEENDLINLSVYFTKVNAYSTFTGDLEMSSFRIMHEDILKAYSNITHIRITYQSTEEHRYCFRYEITMDDENVVIKDIEVSSYSDLKFEIGNIFVRYTNGLQEERNSLKYRTFEQGTEKWLSFLRENIESAYDVIFIFDTYNRWVYCYSTEEVGEHTNIQLTFQNYLEEMEVEPQYENIVTKLWVSSENCSISDVNPLGTEYIYDFSYFIENGLLTEECCEAWKRFEAVVDSSENNLNEIRTNRNTAVKRRLRLETELQEKEISYSDASNVLAVYIKEGNENKVAEYGEKKAKLEEQISSLIASIAEQRDYIESLDSEITKYLEKVTLETAYDDEGKIFTAELLEELQFNMIEKEMTDSSYITAQTLYDYAIEQLKIRNGLQLQISVSINGLKEKMIIPKGKKWNGIIQVGNFFSMVEESEDLRIVGIEYSPSTGKINSIDLSNTLEREDNFSKLEDISSVISKASYTMETMKDVWEESKDANEFYSKMRNEYLDNVATGIKGRNQNCILDMTSGSIFVIDADNKESQLYLGAGLIAFTNDNWLTANLAIDAQGVYADKLIGSMILGEKLYITSDKGDFYIGDIDNGRDAFGLRITDSNNVERIFLGTEITNGERKSVFRLYNKNGTGTCITEDGIIQTYQYETRDWVDSGNRFYSYFWSNSRVIDYKHVYMRIYFRPYRVLSKSLRAGGTVNQQSGTTVTGGGGATTSASGGGYASTSGTDGGYANSYSQTSSAESWNLTPGAGGAMTTPSWDSVATVKNFDNHYHLLRPEYLRHTHSVSISVSVPSHSHSISIPAHSHTVDIPPHSHTINLSFSTEHTHEIEYGIIDLTGSDNYPSSVSLMVNGSLVKGGINNNEIIDIKDYIPKGITTPNTICLTSNTRGMFIVSYFAEEYVSWE